MQLTAPQVAKLFFSEIVKRLHQVTRSLQTCKMPNATGVGKRQLKQMRHVMFGGLAHEPALTLARRLTALLPGDLDRVFFSESGSVAVEIAMKMAVQFWLNQGVRRRKKFLAFTGGYHGDTTGAMAVCDPEAGMHALFQGLLPEQHVVDLP